MTAQISDLIRYNGKTYSLCNLPLSVYLKEKNISPFYVSNTGCYRGYIADWEVVGDKLYLVKLSGNISYTESVGIDYLFPGKSEVFASWYSGEVRLPDGDLIEYVHHGFASVFERDLFLEFKDGVLIKSKVVDNTVLKPDITRNNGVNKKKRKKASKLFGKGLLVCGVDRRTLIIKKSIRQHKIQLLLIQIRLCDPHG